MLRSALTLTLTVVLLSVPAWAQTKTATALRVQESIQVDGHLNEPIWEKAPPATGFIQLQPDKGEPARLVTVVKILYDDTNFYFGFICQDPDPDRIAASLTKRDEDLAVDDSVYVALDTYRDRRNAYFFATNLLGTQRDGRITENGRTADTTWDGIWKSAARRTEEGWTAEFAIPLRTLKYDPGEGKAWGFNLARVIPRFLESSFWSGPLEANTKVSQYGDLAGLDLAKARKKIQIIPHVLTQLEKDEKTQVSMGLDARYAFSQQVSGELTVNPDFATVEADVERINLTRFELSIPEKRNFFLEGAEIYSQRIRLFYSRRIQDIYGGAKVYGKSGGYEFSGMTVQTSPDEALGEETGNFSVLRLKRDVMASSNVGLLVANKVVDGKAQGTAGLDTALYFSDTFRFTGQFAFSYGDQSGSNLAFFLRPSYDSATFHIHIRYTQLGRYFADNANAVGFIRDDNRRELDSAVEKTWWLSHKVFERLQYGSNYNIYWGLDGTLRSWKIDQSAEVDLRNKLSLEVEHHQEFKLFEKEFRNHETGLTLGYNTREWQNAEVTYSFGHNFDSDFHLFEGQVSAKPSQALSLQYSLVRLILDPDPGGESTWIHVLRATQYFTPDLFLKAFYQVNSSIDKHNLQVLFIYRFQPPFGTLQLAYQKGTARFGERGNQGHTLFVKFAYMF